MELERLYKRSKTDALLICDIKTVGGTMIVTTGQIDGAKIDHETECFPKNVGRANETTAAEQAIKEAKAKHAKKIKNGYVLDKSGEVTVKLPMKVKKYQEQKANVVFPCWASPKLNGLNGEFRLEVADAEKDLFDFNLYSRGGDQFPPINHLIPEIVDISTLLKTNTLNGEIYKHGMYLQDISSAVRKPNEDTAGLEFHIFDIPDSPETYDEKIVRLAEIEDLKYVKVIEAVELNSHEEIEKYLMKCLEEEFEGIVIRNKVAVYEYNVRSSNIFKYKLPEDGEYKVVGYKIDKKGHAVFECVTPDEDGAKKFNVKMRGTHEARLAVAAIADTYIGEWMKIEYEELSKDLKPQKPVGLGLRACDAEGNPLE